MLETIKHACASSPVDDHRRLLQIKIGCSAHTKTTHKRNHHMLETDEFHSRRLCHALHFERYKKLLLTPENQKKARKHNKQRLS